MPKKGKFVNQRTGIDREERCVNIMEDEEAQVQYCKRGLSRDRSDLGGAIFL